MRVVNDEVSVPLPNQPQIVRQRCRPAVRQTKSVGHDNRAIPGLPVPMQELFQCGRFVHLEGRCRDPFRGRPLYAPAGDRISPCIGVDRDVVPRQDVEQIQVKVKRRRREHRSFAAQQLCQDLCQLLGLRRRFERRRPAGRELGPGAQFVARVAHTQVEHGCEVEHDLSRLALAFLPVSRQFGPAGPGQCGLTRHSRRDEVWTARATKRHRRHLLREPALKQRGRLQVARGRVAGIGDLRCQIHSSDRPIAMDVKLDLRLAGARPVFCLILDVFDVGPIAVADRRARSVRRSPRVHRNG